MRVLYIHGTIVPPATDLRRDPFFLLSEHLEGDVLHPIWFLEPKEVEAALGPDSYPEYQRGRFRYHWFLAGNSGPGGLRKKLAVMWFYISTGLQIHRQHPFDCVITYSHMATGLCGVLLKWLTGSKLIVEVTTAPNLSIGAEKRERGLRDRMKALYSDFCLHISLWACDRAQLRGPGLIDSYKMLRNVPTSVMPGFVPVSLIPRQIKGDEKIVLFVGQPWYLKGADLLIEAFRRLAADFPDVKLKLLGYNPPQQAKALAELTAGSAQIEILKARTHPEVIEVIGKATVFVLPSRCEGTPRVVLEALAAGVPVIGSDVGGIPYVVRNGENGFVVPSGNVEELEARLRQLLSDSELRNRMGARGYELAHTQFSEEAYCNRFAQAVAEVVASGC